MSQVMALSDDDSNSSSTEYFNLKEVEAIKYRANVIPVWLYMLIQTINIVTDTKTLLKRSETESAYCDLRIIFVGIELDVNTSFELFNFLKNIITKLSTKHTNDVGGKFKQWRSFAEGCSNKLLERATKLNNKLEHKFHNDIESRFSVDNFSLSDEEYEDEIDEIINDDQYSVELYNKYQETKLDKILKYIEEQNVGDEKISSRTRRTDEDSFESGKEAAKNIPLRVSSKLESKTKRRKHGQ